MSKDNGTPARTAVEKLYTRIMELYKSLLLPRYCYLKVEQGCRLQDMNRFT